MIILGIDKQDILKVPLPEDAMHWKRKEIKTEKQGLGLGIVIKNEKVRPVEFITVGRLVHNQDNDQQR